MLNLAVISALILIGASVMYCLVLITFARARRRLPLGWFALSCLLMGIYSLAMLVVSVPGSPRIVICWAGPIGYATAAIFVASSTRYARYRDETRNAPLDLLIELSIVLVVVASLIPGVIYDFSQIRSWVALRSTYRFAETTVLAPVACGVIGIGLLNLLRWFAVRQRNWTLLGGASVLCLSGINDMAISLKFYDGPFTAALGATAFLVAVALDASSEWGDEAHQLAELKSQLEKRVELRSAELAATMEELSKSERLAELGRLAASVGHEINNPLTYVIANLELLKVDHDHREECIDDAIEGSLRIAGIVKHLHTLSKTSDPSLWQAVNLAERVSVAVRTVRPRLSKQHRINTDLISHANIWGDPGRTVQVFVNLLTNAIESFRNENEPKQITIAIRQLDSQWEVTIADTGCGIEKEMLERAFEPFVSTRSEGLGLGLSVVRSILDEINGEIELTSRPSEGSTAIVRFEQFSTTPFRINEVKVGLRDDSLAGVGYAAGND